MQNKFKHFRSILKGKGYYIVLLLCTVAVGVTGYFLLSDKESALPNETESSVSTNAGTVPSEDRPAANVAATQGSEASSLPTEKLKPLRLKKPVSGELLVSFAADRLAYNETTRDWRTHEGIDIAATEGESVLAAANGTVYSIYEDESLGMTVVLQHEGGYTTHYSNLAEQVSVRVGDRLQAGDTIGNVGHTAGTETATAPHIHFALYENNTPLDPGAYWE